MKKSDKKLNRDIKRTASWGGKNKGGERKWFRMVSAGTIFIPASNNGWACAFRTAVVMKEEVSPLLLQRALNAIKDRFPSIVVHLKAGLFWHYLESAQEPLAIAKEDRYPLRKFSLKSRRYVIRVLYQNNRIIFECFHAITDANGAFIFLNTLIKEYLMLSGIKIDSSEGCKNSLDKPIEEETEDAFLRFADPKYRRKYADKKALQIRYEKEDYGVFNMLHIAINSKELKAVAKNHNATIGEFLTAVLAYVVYKDVNSVKITKKKKHPIKISVPIDLRRKFPSQTLRNFSLYKNMELDHNESHDFDSTLEQIKNQYETIDDDYLLSSMTNNVKMANTPFVKFMPLPIKNIALKLGYNILGENLTTMSFSNLGVLKTPEEFRKHIIRYEFALGPLKVTPVNVACVSYNDETILTVSSRAKNTNIEKEIVSLLRELGLELALDTNRQI